MGSVKIKTDRLNVYYRRTHVLQNINVEICSNKITSLIGPSGCGKSTFLRTLNRLNDLVEEARITGGVYLDGKDIYAQCTDVAKLRKRVGMVFQQPTPFPMSVYDNVAYGPKLHGVRERAGLDRIVEKSLQKAAVWEEVKDRLHKPALGLSGGQQQRLCIARALAVEPEVLLLDEPTSALDPNASFKVEELMRALQPDYTVIVVTHNMQQAARISDDAVFFLDGKVIEYGAARSLFFHPQDKRTRDYVSGKFG